MSLWLERLWYPAEEARTPSLVALPLAAASTVFRAAVGARNALYDCGALPPVVVAGATVVSVGNLNVGGAGKTPAVIFLARLASSRGRKVAVLSRGYGRQSSGDIAFSSAGGLPSSSESGDEPLLIARRCPEASLLVGSDRARLAQAARAKGADFILLDDGMQHRRLARDVEIVVVDEEAGFGNGRLLPWGPLREPVSALERADLIWLRVSEGRRSPLPRFRAPLVRVRHSPKALLDPGGAERPTDALRGRRAIALAAVARPGRFLHTLSALGIEVAEARLFPDHHRFTAPELPPLDGLPVVTTEKDLARLPPSLPAWAVRMETEILEGADSLAKALRLAHP